MNKQSALIEKNRFQQFLSQVGESLVEYAENDYVEKTEGDIILDIELNGTILSWGEGNTNNKFTLVYDFEKKKFFLVCEWDAINLDSRDYKTFELSDDDLKFFPNDELNLMKGE